MDTDEFPIFRVDERGNIQRNGQLVTLVATESVWLPDTTVIDGLPREMHDAAPKGFLMTQAIGLTTTSLLHSVVEEKTFQVT